MFFSMTPTIILSFLFPFINHPLAMTLTIILQTLLICLMIANNSQTVWFSYILFLVFLGGMLVLFIYITSLASNEMFPTIIKSIMFLLTMFTLMTLLNMLIDQSLLNIFSFNSETQHFLSDLSSYNEPVYLITKLYNMPTNFLTLMLVTYLLLTLIAIVKITNIFLGPLRQQS